MYRLALFSLILIPFTVFAQESTTTVMEWYDKLPMDMGDLAEKMDAIINGAIVGGLGMILEFAMRYIPSKKPLSILHGIAAIVRISGEMLTKVADGLDRVLPQKTK